MKSVCKTTFILFLALFMVENWVQISLAYSLNNTGYYNSSIDMKWDSGLNSDYRTATANAIDEWNSKNISPVSYYTSINSLNVIYQTNNLGTGVYGQYSAWSGSSDPNHTTLRFDITYAKFECEGLNKTWRTPQSTGVHELGHAAGLADLSSGTAIMNTSRNRESIFTPRTDDVNGVNASW